MNLNMKESEGLLDLEGAEICGDPEERNPPISLPRQRSDSVLLAVDIGGTLIKVVNFEGNAAVKSHEKETGGLLRFVKFQTSQLDECMEFIRSKKLLHCRGFAEGSISLNVKIKATGGGAYKFADAFKEKLDVSLDKLDEMDTVVTGANFLLKNIPNESFRFINGVRIPVDVDQKNLFPYLLVNIGSGVSMIKVMGDRKFERVTGTHIGGGTMFGLAKLLTGCIRYDEFLQLSQQGDNLVLDLIAKDICGELVCQKQGLSGSTLASSFGKVLSSRRILSDYKAEDLATTLLSAFTYNIAQVSFLVASLLKLKRVYFGGSYIRGHASTMDNISYAIDFWSKGQMHAIFLRHEGFLGALGALLSNANLKNVDLILEDSIEGDPAIATTRLWTLAPKPFCSEQGFIRKGCEEFNINSSKVDDGKLTNELKEDTVFPYLLVNIGSGVSMIEVIGKGKFERIIGTHLGGGTILGLARLLTGCTSYDDFLELSQRGNNLSVDLTVGDIYGEHGYPKIGLPATTTASSFGKVISNKLSDYKAEDFAAALLNAFTYNIGQITYFVAQLSGLKRIFFRGTYICGHAKTMDKISRALKYWSKDQVQTTFLCHEGFMGTLGAFWSYENMGIHDLAANKFTKEVLLSAPYMLGKAQVLPPMNSSMNNESSLQEDLKSLQHSNAELRAELKKLRQENIELKSALSEMKNRC